MNARLAQSPILLLRESWHINCRAIYKTCTYGSMGNGRGEKFILPLPPTHPGPVLQIVFQMVRRNPEDPGGKRTFPFERGQMQDGVGQKRAA